VSNHLRKSGNNGGRCDANTVVTSRGNALHGSVTHTEVNLREQNKTHGTSLRHPTSQERVKMYAELRGNKNSKMCGIKNPHDNTTCDIWDDILAKPTLAPNLQQVAA